MIDELVAELSRDGFLQSFRLRVDEFDDLTGLHVDQMIVVLIGMFFVTRSAIAEIVAGDDPSLVEEANRPINGGDRNVWVDLVGSAMQLFHVGVVMGRQESTWAMTRRCSVIRMPFSTQSFSMRSDTTAPKAFLRKDRSKRRRR